MSKKIGGHTSQQSLQLEIAILQKKILSFKPCYAKLKIPALLGNDIDETVDLPMPLHLSVTYGDIIIPKGTKLLVQTVAGNYNELKIVGFYDKPKSYNFIELLKDYAIPDSEGNFKPNLPDDYGTFDYDEI